MKTRVRLLSLLLCAIFVVSLFPIGNRAVMADGDYRVYTQQISTSISVNWSKVVGAQLYMLTIYNLTPDGNKGALVYRDTYTGTFANIPDDVLKEYGSGGTQYIAQIDAYSRNDILASFESEPFKSYRKFDTHPKYEVDNNLVFNFNNRYGLEKALSYELRMMDGDGEYFVVSKDVVTIPEKTSSYILDLSAYAEEMNNYQFEFSLLANRETDRNTAIEVRDIYIPCSHSEDLYPDQYAYLEDYHMHICSVCGQDYGVEPHVMGIPTFKNGMMYAECSKCCADMSGPDNREAVTRLNVVAGIVEIGRSVKAPNLYATDSGKPFEMTSYTWYKGTPSNGEKLKDGTPYDYGTYTLVISVKIKDSSLKDIYIDTSDFSMYSLGYISGKTTSTETTATAELTFVVKEDSVLELKTPTISPDMYIFDFYKNTEVIIDGVSTPIMETGSGINVINLDENKSYFYYNHNSEYNNYKNIRFCDIGTDNIQVNILLDRLNVNDLTINKDNMYFTTMTAVESVTPAYALLVNRYSITYSINYDLGKCPTGVEGFCERLYTCALNRESDPTGMKTWVGVLTDGSWNGADVARGFFFSDELINSNISDDEFITRLYATFMDRKPDGDGFKTWQDAFTKGWTREQVFMGFVDSQEWANVCFKYGIASGGAAVPNITLEPTPKIIAFATRLYTTCLCRDGEEEGIKNWAEFLANRKMTGTQAAYNFFFSSEFLAQDVDNGEYVTRLYATFMGREPDKGGYDMWVGLLKSGEWDREKVFYGFAQSDEFAKLCKEAGIAV